MFKLGKEMIEKEKEYITNTMGHVWQLNNYNGEVDIFGYNAGTFCNGPICTKCGYGFCHHCNKLPNEKCVK